MAFTPLTRLHQQTVKKAHERHSPHKAQLTWDYHASDFDLAWCPTCVEYFTANGLEARYVAKGATKVDLPD